ncbi:MAG: Eco57I restriction-modification methylase domain-containing protein [Actinomycetota bacterium]|nr:Eco57I restriction-modification methylase domain-containing protein [Actinomycetota bacterium]
MPSREEAAHALLERAELRRQEFSARIGDRHRSKFGQFFTPGQVARHLASLLDVPKAGKWRVVDPGAGTGSLTAAVMARAIEAGFKGNIAFTAFEIDESLAVGLDETLEECVAAGGEFGITVTTDRHTDDFLSWVASHDQHGGQELTRFDAVVMNPPYKKIARGSRERLMAENAGCGSPNLYTAFVTMALRVMGDGGQIVAITPRSFANGPYFLSFRRDLLLHTSLRHVHVYESRSSAFADTEVLQENVIWRADVGAKRGTVVISHSESPAHEAVSRAVPHKSVVSDDDGNLFLHFRLDEDADAVAGLMEAMPETLTTLGVEVSTGIVVDFRSREHLSEIATPDTVPMVYPAHLRGGVSHWPDGVEKPSYFVATDTSRKMLLPEGWYVVVKRFSAKEEKRRVVASLWDPVLNGGPVAFDNKTNIFHIRKQGLDEEVARGLTAYLNTRFVDEAFRQFSGHTQVNATDLKELRYPTVDQLRIMGQRLESSAPWGDEMDDLLVASMRPERKSA